MHVNVLDFMFPPRGELGVEGPVQSKLPQERSGWVRLSGTSLCLKRLVSRQIVLWMPCQTVLSRLYHHGPARFCLGFLSILIHTVSLKFQPMPLLKRMSPNTKPSKRKIPCRSTAG